MTTGFLFLITGLFLLLTNILFRLKPSKRIFYSLISMDISFLLCIVLFVSLKIYNFYVLVGVFSVKMLLTGLAAGLIVSIKSFLDLQKYRKRLLEQVSDINK